MAVTSEAVKRGIEMMALAGLKGDSDFDSKKIATWMTLFCDWSDKEFLAACTKVAREGTFFPSAGELRASVTANIDDRAELVWQMARDAIQKATGIYGSLFASDLGGDAAGLWALSRVGVEDVCNMTSENRNILAASFRRLYRVAVEGNMRLWHIPGKCERDNTLRGVPLTPALIGRPDLAELPELPSAPQGSLPMRASA